jgi:hypothetical protein
MTGTCQEGLSSCFCANFRTETALTSAVARTARDNIRVGANSCGDFGVRLVPMEAVPFSRFEFEVLPVRVVL